jgi:hypothetical protein
MDAGGGPLSDARSGVDNLTMLCSAEPHMWRRTMRQGIAEAMH